MAPHERGDTGAGERHRRHLAVSLRKAWLVTFGLLVLLSTLWNLAVPLTSPADENERTSSGLPWWCAAT